jgi:AcrR family transcriptional regulator
VVVAARDPWHARRVRPPKATSSPSASRPYGGQSKLEREQARRERLLRAGMDLFGTEGYASTPIERLCGLAGVTARHFYELFPTREALLRAVYDEVVTAVHKSVVEALSRGPEDPMQRVAHALDAFVHAYLDDPRRARIAFLEVIGVSPELERHRRSVIHAFAFVIRAQAEALAEQGKVEPGDMTLPAIAMTGAVNELLVEWMTRGGAQPMSQLIEVLINLFNAVIEGSSPKRPAPRRARSTRTRTRTQT